MTMSKVHQKALRVAPIGFASIFLKLSGTSPPTFPSSPFVMLRVWGRSEGAFLECCELPASRLCACAEANNLYVTGLPAEVDEQRLKVVFHEHGKVR